MRASKATNQFLAEVGEALRAKELQSHLASRTAYVEALGRGLTVLEWSDPKARAEFETFFNEVKAQIKLV